jgi:hypothetical protein
VDPHAQRAPRRFGKEILSEPPVMACRRAQYRLANADPCIGRRAYGAEVSNARGEDAVDRAVPVRITGS